MRRTIKITDCKFTLIRCDGFQPGSLTQCESAFKGRSNSKQKNISEARKLGWVIGEKDLCDGCHRNTFYLKNII